MKLEGRKKEVNDEPFSSQTQLFFPQAVFSFLLSILLCSFSCPTLLFIAFPRVFFLHSFSLLFRLNQVNKTLSLLSSCFFAPVITFGNTEHCGCLWSCKLPRSKPCSLYNHYLPVSVRSYVWRCRTWSPDDTLCFIPGDQGDKNHCCQNKQ